MAKTYRDTLSLPEGLVWQRLRVRPFGLIFRKQHPFGNLRLDFYCAARALAVEIDGMSHDTGDRPERDECRDTWLRGHGIETLRVAARDVLRDPDQAIEAISHHALRRPVVFDAPAKRKRSHPSDPLRGPPPHQDGEE